ncbi:MAG: bifunctional phosphoribosylaminoimidazolecarboxamide formyltransferase/IMP cyclohydrolase [Thermoleophilia bacterium]|nr:bifunctional phosphoribosylaminoimidazolecarboxamide formyltransferase/IMP cyclohydrolase [Thermoleophilia bacterium]
MTSRRALLSVSDKTGLVDLARGLSEAGVELISTGGTARTLRDAGLTVTDVSEVTGHPEIMGGRVKTLHPRIHGGILARRDHEGDAHDMVAGAIQAIDMVVVNLYPFEEAAARDGLCRSEVVEEIDIGGPAMVRAAAKNHDRVVVVTDPTQYGDVLAEVATGDWVGEDTRRSLAAAAFRRTAAYDTAIAAWMSREGDADDAFPDRFTLGFRKELECAYGENPHQRGAYYSQIGAPQHLLGGVAVLHGKPLSYNNLLDVDAARNLVAEFDEPAVVIVKHNNPCGVALGDDLASAYLRAKACDPVSAFGGVYAVNRTVDAALATHLADMFVEVLWAPAYDPDALKILTRKPNVRLLQTGDTVRPGTPGELVFRRVLGGVLVQDPDEGHEGTDTMNVVSVRAPTVQEWTDLVFAWTVSKHVKSNAIVFARDGATVGIGAGQMSRVDSVRIAIAKAVENDLPIVGSAMASDAFFPFPDAPEMAIGGGATGIVHPGGSIRDNEVIAAVDALGATMVTTGRRHFRH